MKEEKKPTGTKVSKESVEEKESQPAGKVKKKQWFHKARTRF